MRSIGILFSRHGPCLPRVSTVRRAVARAGRDLKPVPIDADGLRHGQLDGLDLLVNTLGPCYPEDGWRHLLAYYRAGGIVLTIGPEPFTKPYTVVKGACRLLGPTHDALHALGVVDAWAPTGPVDTAMRFELLSPRYGFLAELSAAGRLPAMQETCSGYYHLVSKTDPPGGRWAAPVQDAQLERACGWRDAAGRLVAVPISRVDHFERGSLIFLNFVPADPGFYASRAGLELLAGMIRTGLQARIRFRTFTPFARYREDETPGIGIELGWLAARAPAAARFDVEIQIDEVDSGARVRAFRLENLTLGARPLRRTRELQGLPEGFYRVTGTAFVDGQVLAESRTGFYKVSDKSIARRLKAFAPIRIDVRKSTDFCLRNGKPFAMHGTNYFPTDIYRDSYLGLNADQCDADLKELRHAGLNILRTGVWQGMEAFYDDTGRIRERGLRSLDALFLTAARHGMPVQFVLGAFVMNHWDREQCPIHNPAMRTRTVTAFASFARRYAGWPNVQVDAINEPSYSMAGLWRPARPSGDPHERKNWTKWLKRRYRNDITGLRDAWGVTSEQVPSFADADLPDDAQFQRGYDSKSQGYHAYAVITDFYAFARESFSGWVADIRRAVKSRDPDMLFMIGRDESLRIPSQQYEAYRGNFDMVNWHQWHRDAVVFSEYCLNRVRGLPCCGQELGVYPYADTRGLPRLDDRDAADLLERKLLYTFGNWLQWQAHCDPYMIPLQELGLGLFRADHTDRPHLERTRLLAWIEEKTAPRLLGRDEDAIETLTVHPSAYYFSADNTAAAGAVHNSIVALHYYAKAQSHMVLEHTFRPDNAAQIGDPKLIVFPAAQMVSEAAWQQLIAWLKKGKTVLLSGAAAFDEYWRPADRLRPLGLPACIEKACTVERLRIGNRVFDIDLHNAVGRHWPATAVDKAVLSRSGENRVVCHAVGRGTLVLCPVPVELGGNMEATAALYRLAMKQAGVRERVCRVAEQPGQSNILVYPIAYRRCTAYTIVNEGDRDEIAFTDLASGVRVKLGVQANRGARLWLDKNGHVIGAYLNAPVTVGTTSIRPNGDLAIFRRAGRWILMPGRREKGQVVAGRTKVPIRRDQLFRELTV
ncbi:MAG: hypothetical protein JXR37_34315 [Kiritimatiellae bacterium]|nr:hypothetical protein [Kiritimatiellia bacterium]